MSLSDDQLVRSVRESVDARPGAGVPVEEVVRRGRRRTAARRGSVGAVVAVLAVAAVALSVGGVPLLGSAPPARQPSVTLTPDPSRTEAQRPVTDMYALGDAALSRAGLQPSGSWSVDRAASLDNQRVYEGAIIASSSGAGYWLRTASVPSLEDPGAMSCASVVPSGYGCQREPQDDEAVLFEVSYEGELVGYRLLHASGFVSVDEQQPTMEGEVVGPPPTPEQLRTLALDPDLRW